MEYKLFKFIGFAICTMSWDLNLIILLNCEIKNILTEMGMKIDDKK